jgi:nucleotide-binding universal stress UspA family protein
MAFATAIAERFGASVEVLHVLELPYYFPPEALISLPSRDGQSIDDFARARAEKDMQLLLAPFEKGARIKIDRRIEVGVTSETIFRVASAGGHDLIVVGTHGRHGFDRLLLGSVAEKVVRGAPCSVLTVKKRAEPPAS